MDARRYTIVYPERRTVSARDLTLWASDAIANGDTGISATESELESDMELVIDILHDSGYATVVQ